MTQRLDPQEANLLHTVLDRLIPAEDTFGSGGEVALEHVAGAMHNDARLGRCLAAIVVRSYERHNAAFVTLAEPLQVAVLREVEQRDQQLFNALLIQAYSGYYSSPLTVRALGLPPGPPAMRPHRLEPLDPGRLEIVAARGPIYKPV